MLELVIDQRRRDLGGLEVGRVLPYQRRRMVGPHPHIGLSTVTYLFDGEVMHRDSVRSEQAIRPGAVNWMVAGRGVPLPEPRAFRRVM